MQHKIKKKKKKTVLQIQDLNCSCARKNCYRTEISTYVMQDQRMDKNDKRKNKKEKSTPNKYRKNKTMNKKKSTCNFTFAAPISFVAFFY